MASYLRSEVRRIGKTRVTVLPSGKIVQLLKGSRLWEALPLSGNERISHCGGKARCRTCRIKVLEGGRDLSRIDRRERAQLNDIARDEPKVRLACQVVLGNEQVTIELAVFTPQQRHSESKDPSE